MMRRDEVLKILARHVGDDIVVPVYTTAFDWIAIRPLALNYLAHGAKLGWLIYPAKRLVEVYRQNADGDILTTDDTLQGDDVLTGFVLSVHEIFALN